jgi:hypothetical protein
MFESKLPRMQAKRRFSNGQCLAGAEDLAWQINRITTNRKTQMPEVQSNLIRAACEGLDHQQGGAIGVSAKDMEFRAGGKTVCIINLAGSGFDGLLTNGGIAEKSVLGRMSQNSGKICFFDIAELELWLHEFGKMPCAGKNNQTCRVAIQPMR